MISVKAARKDSDKERSRSNSKEKQHYRSGSKSKGIKQPQESHKSSKHKVKEKHDASRAKESYGYHDRASSSTYRKIKTPAEKKETIALKITSATCTQTDFDEQIQFKKRKSADKKEIANVKATSTMSTQTELVEHVTSRKGKSAEKKEKSTAIMSTQTDFVEQTSSKKGKMSEKKETPNIKITAVISTQTDFLEQTPSKRKKEEISVAMSTQTDFMEQISSKKGKISEKKESANVQVTTTMSTQTDFMEQTSNKKPKSTERMEITSTKDTAVISTQTDFVEQISSNMGKSAEKKGKITTAAMSIQTDFAEQISSKMLKSTEKKDSANMKQISVVSTQTDFVEQSLGKNEKSVEKKEIPTSAVSTQTDFIEIIQTKRGKLVEKKETVGIKPTSVASTQTDLFEQIQSKKGKSEKIKSKSIGSQSETFKTLSKEVQVACTLKSVESQTDPREIPYGNDTSYFIFTSVEAQSKRDRRKCAVKRLKEIDSQIEKLLQVKHNIYNELMLESDEEPAHSSKCENKSDEIYSSECTNSSSKGQSKIKETSISVITESDSSKVVPETKDLRICLEDVQHMKSLPSSKDNEDSMSKVSQKSRKRKIAELAKEANKNSRKILGKEKKKKTDNEAAKIIEAVDVVNTSALLENLNTVVKKDRKKRKVEEEKPTDTRGSLNIKISLKNLRASPYKPESDVETPARNLRKSFSAEIVEENVKQKRIRRTKDAKANKDTKAKENKESKSKIDLENSREVAVSRINDDETERFQIIEKEVRNEESALEVVPVVETMENIVDESYTEEREPILKIKLPFKKFRSTKKSNPEVSNIIDEVNLMISKDAGDISPSRSNSLRDRASQSPRSKQKSDRRSKQTSNIVVTDENELQGTIHDKKLFMCRVSLRRYNIGQLEKLKETVHFETDHHNVVEPLHDNSLLLDNKSDVNIDETVAIIQSSSEIHLPSEVSVNNLSDINVRDESPIKTNSFIEPSSISVPNEPRIDISPVSTQMIDEVTQIVNENKSVPKVVTAAPTDQAVVDGEYEIEFKTFGSSVLVLKVINSTVLAGADNGKLYYYDIKTGEVLHTLHLSKKPLTCLCIHKKEEELQIYVGSLNGKIRIFDFGSRRVIDTVKLDEGVQCMESCWGYMFVGTHKGQLVRYDAKKEKVEDSVKVYDTSILAIKATQEGARRVLLVATRSELVSVRDAMTGLLMRTMESSFYPTVYTILLNKNLVYCGTSHHDILVYTFQDGQIACKHEATNSKGVVCLKIIGNLLFAGCYNGNVYIYNSMTNTYLGQMAGPGGMLLSMEVMEDKIIVGTKSNKLKSWQIPKNFLDQL